jgi:hypothetical protein
MRPRRFRRVTAGVMVPGGRCLRRGPERPGRGTDAKGLVLGDHAPGLRHHAGAALEMLTAKSSRSARSLLPAVRHPGPLRRAVLRTLCSSAVSLVILGLFAFPGSGGQDPYHIHVVIGSTPANAPGSIPRRLLRSPSPKPLMPRPACGCSRSGETAAALLPSSREMQAVPPSRRRPGGSRRPLPLPGSVCACHSGAHRPLLRSPSLLRGTPDPSFGSAGLPIGLR